MTDEQIVAKIGVALKKVAPKREFDLGDLSANMKELGLDSVDLMEMIGELEESIGATFSDEDLAQVDSLRQLVDLAKREAN